MAGDRGRGASERVAAAVEAVGSGGWEFRNAYRRQLLALSRRIRLLGPFAEELQEARRGPAEEEEQERALAPLADALEEALDLLQLGRDGSRIFLVRACLLLSLFLVPHLCWIPDAWLPVRVKINLRPFSIISLFFKIKTAPLSFTRFALYQVCRSRNLNQNPDFELPVLPIRVTIAATVILHGVYFAMDVISMKSLYC